MNSSPPGVHIIPKDTQITSKRCDFLKKILTQKQKVQKIVLVKFQLATELKSYECASNYEEAIFQGKKKKRSIRNCVKYQGQNMISVEMV